MAKQQWTSDLDNRQMYIIPKSQHASRGAKMSRDHDSTSGVMPRSIGDVKIVFTMYARIMLPKSVVMNL